MTWRRGAIALARAANALFFIITAAYCFLTYSPFAYNQFIKPSVLPLLTDFVAVSPWLFWVMLLATTLTLMPWLTNARLKFGAGVDTNAAAAAVPGFSRAAASYVAISAAVGVFVLLRPPLRDIGSTPAAALVGVLACVWPVWLAVVDHRLWPAPRIRPADTGRLLAASALAALLAWGTYAIAAPFRVAHTVGIDPTSTLGAGAAAALVADFYIFMGVFLALAAAVACVRLANGGGRSEFWAINGVGAALIAVIMYSLVCASITFTGWRAWICSVAIAAALAAVWVDMALLRAHDDDALDSVDLFTAPIAGRGSKMIAAAVAMFLPLIAYALVEAVHQLDWNFLLQKVSVLVVWTTAFNVAYALVGRRVRSYPTVVLAAVPLAAWGMYQFSRTAVPAGAVESYAVVDPSYRLVRDAQLAHSSETAEYYAFLREHTLLPAARVHPSHSTFARTIAPAPHKPDIFLIVVDSLRRDYLSPYNSRVNFTPAIAALARESFVYERAFTRYAGTGLAVPSIWAGGLVPHSADVPEFLRRNALVRLLDANHYRRLLTLDNIVHDLVPREADWFVQLDRGKRIMDFDLCGTLPEVEQKLEDDRQPTFFYALPQNVHLAVATKRPVPAGETYPPGFYDRIASSVRSLDGCVGTFIDELKRRGRFDDSVIILTADHGDSLGEDGRWGHAYYMYPEVMQVPLIVHLPPWLADGVRTDLDAVVFTADLTPSLYALLGSEPKDRGRLFGLPLFTPRDADWSARRTRSYLLASSYGAVYGLLRQNGRQMYVVDAVDGTEYAFDLTGRPRPLSISPAVTSLNRRLIAEQLTELSTVYGVAPAQ